MTTNTNTRLHWIKYNPTEWQGHCSALTDAEYGLYHRAVEKLWVAPGNVLHLDDLRRRLRIEPNTDRSACFDRLLGMELRLSPNKMVDIQVLHEAAAAAIARSTKASLGGQRKAELAALAKASEADSQG